MKKNDIFSILIFISIALFFLNACKLHSLNKTMPRAENGVLDLSAWDLEKDGPVALNGDWEFYWHAHWKPDDFSDENPPAISGFIEVPGSWNGFKVNEEKIRGAGYATYRLRIHLEKTSQFMAFKLLDMATAFTMYVNGQELTASGIPGKTFKVTFPQFFPQVVEFHPESKLVDLVIIVSNFHHRKGGAWEPILLGMSEDIWQIRQKALNRNFFLFGGILIMGLYHIGLFIFRTKDKSNLFFGIFCFLIAIRSLVTGERYLINVFPDFNWEIHTKLAYLTFYLGVPIFTLYFRYIFPKEFSKHVIYVVNVIGVLFSGIVLFTPARIYTYTAPLFQIFTLAASCYAFYILILALKRNHRGALVCLSGFVILFITIVNDILYSNLLIQTGYMIQLGFFLFIFSQASLLSFRFSKTFTTVALQRKKLEEANTACMKEIVERKRTEEALIESEEKYRLVVENANDAVAVAQDGMIRFVNRRGVELSGYSEEELRTEPFTEFVHPKDRKLVLQNYLRMLSGESVPNRYAFRFIHKDGSIRWIEISVVRITWENSPATLSILHDITDKRRLEEELFKAQKLESIGILAGGIAHDFNNILAGIIGNISLAKIDIDQNSNTYHLLNEAERASERATTLTGQLLTFSKGGAPVRRITNVSDVIVDCSTFALRGSKVRCDYNFSSDLWPVEIDEGQINQVIQNIIINACQAMPIGGTIRISAENITVETNIGLPLQPGRYVKMTFQDQGSGIPEKNINKIFDPFFSTKQTGSGLGLTIAYTIVKRHDGHLVVNSQVGLGTTFDVYLPSSRRKAQKKTKDVPNAIQGKGKILAMDDEQTVRDVIYQMLCHMGYDVELASEGQEVIKLYRRAIQADEPFDAVILDLTVPGAMGGKETISRLREIDSNVKAIIASGYSNDPVMSDYKNYGFCGIAVKPFNIQKLARILSDVLKL